MSLKLLEQNHISYATLKNWQRLWVLEIWEKLTSRANKRFSEKKIIPQEYIDYSSIIENTYSFQEMWFSIEEILFSIILNLTKNVKNLYLNDELSSWNIKNDRIIIDLFEADIRYEWDILWWIYQSLLTEWQKNLQWSYYTPNYVVKNIIDEYFQDWMKFIDPCCWTWQFLLQIKSSNPEDIWGTDIDEIAVKLARINLMIKYSWFDFLPNVFCRDALNKENTLFEKNILPSWYFDLVTTNPPWWAKIDKKYLWYSVKSWESFSFFIERWIDLLKKWWVLSYILPESILNVKTHEDIRKILLDYDITSIYELWRIFTWVFTPAIRLDIKKQDEDWNIKIFSNETYVTKKSLFAKNSNYAFSIHINWEDSNLLDKIYSHKSIYLNNGNADWALWIVTWNNKKFISDEKKDWYIPLYTWKEVSPYFLKEPEKFLFYEPEKYQQIAPIEKYETKPKLIYKFISNKLVFSFDEEWVFTLNSANIVIPKIDYSIKVIVALFNSALYQKIFQKKFNSIKVLKSHIQELPLPIFKHKDVTYIEGMVDEIIQKRNLEYKEELDNYIFNLLTN